MHKGKKRYPTLELAVGSNIIEYLIGVVFD